MEDEMPAVGMAAAEETNIVVDDIKVVVTVAEVETVKTSETTVEKDTRAEVGVMMQNVAVDESLDVVVEVAVAEQGAAEITAVTKASPSLTSRISRLAKMTTKAIAKKLLSFPIPRTRVLAVWMGSEDRKLYLEKE